MTPSGPKLGLVVRPLVRSAPNSVRHLTVLPTDVAVRTVPKCWLSAVVLRPDRTLSMTVVPGNGGPGLVVPVVSPLVFSVLPPSPGPGPKQLTRKCSMPLLLTVRATAQVRSRPRKRLLAACTEVAALLTPRSAVPVLKTGALAKLKSRVPGKNLPTVPRPLLNREWRYLLKTKMTCPLPSVLSRLP